MAKDRDLLGQRMKGYEYVSRYMLTPKIPIIVRLDGKAFHTFTKGFDKPFDLKLKKAMKKTALYLAKNIQGCIMSYTQSDEITLVLLDTRHDETDSWFGGNLQKICSVSASMCTAYFNKFLGVDKLAFFDSRAFQIPMEDLPNNLVWRLKDCYKNAITQVAHCHYSHKQLHRVPTSERLKMIEGKYEFKPDELYGTLYVKTSEKDSDITYFKEYNEMFTYMDIRNRIEDLGYIFTGLELHSGDENDSAN